MLSDLTGKRFGKLVVVSLAYSKGGRFWNCHCDCGSDCIVSTSHLNGGQKACDKCGRIADLLNKSFGRLTVVELIGVKEAKCWWRCRCICGNEIKVTSQQLLSGHTKSCGCLHSDIAREMHTKHGDRFTRLYGIWKSMRGRCTYASHTDWKYYGARGISVCPEWNDYLTFKEWSLSHGYADNLSIDRIDSNGNYGPDNCRWVTQTEQANNKSNSRFLVIDGVKHTVTEWSRITGVKRTTICNRLKHGWSDKDAVYR